MTVTDNGRGIPVQIHEKAGVSGVVVVFTSSRRRRSSATIPTLFRRLPAWRFGCQRALRMLKVEVCTDGRLYGVEFRSEADETGKIISGKP